MGSETTDSELEAELLTHHADAFGWALACCERDPVEAEDVLQISYERVLNGSARFSARSAFRTWLFGVIRLTAIERRRTRISRLGLLRRWFESETPLRLHESPVDLELEERNQQLVRALSALSRRQQEVLHLVFYDGFTIEEAAKVMNVSLGTARTHYQRGKSSLREFLGEQEKI